MRTLFVQTDEYGEVIINHNSDWSGPVHVAWKDVYANNENKEIWLPGKLLIAMSAEAARDEVRSQLIDFLEGEL